MKNKKDLSADELYSGIGHISEKWILMADDSSEIEKAKSELISKKKEKSFVLYEIKKLLGIKYLWIFLFVLLMLNSVTAWYTADKTIAAQEPTQMISEFFDKYFENPDELDAYHAEIEAFNNEQTALYLEAIQEGNFDYKVQTMPDLYSTEEDYPDTRLFDKLYNTVNAAENYPSVLENVIDRAWKNLGAFESMGIHEDSFAYRYQLRVIKLYEEMIGKVKIEVEYTRGWDEYFAYDTVNIFIFFMIIMLGSLIFAGEKQSGFMPIMRTAKNGRARTAIAKIVTMLLLTSLFVLLFTASTFAVYGLRIGYSSFGNVIQSLGTFTLSSYQITIGEYFIITVLVKLLTFASFSLLILAFSVIFYNYVMIYFAGLAIFGLNFLLYALQNLDSNSVLKNLNLVATASVNPLFERYRAVNFFGSVAGFVPSMLVAFTLVILICITLTIFLYVKGTGGARIGAVDTAVSWCMIKMAALRQKLVFVRRKQPIKIRSYSRSLVLAEIFKTLISSRFILVIILILTLKVWYSYSTNSPVNSYADKVYKEYMTILEGEITEEKLSYLADERAMIDEILSKQKMMQEGNINNTISFEEYSDYLSDYNYARSRSEILTLIEDHASYLCEKEAESGIKGWFIYDTGWRKMYSEGADLFLYCSILLLLTGSFAAEYVSGSSNGSFAQLLRSTKNGRNKTFNAKLISSGMIALTLAAITCAIDITIIASGYDLPAWDAPLLSIQLFSDVSENITISEYLILFLVMRMAGALLMAMLVCALSEILAKYVPVLGTVVILTLLPALCAYFGFIAADRINFLNLFAGTPLFLQSSELSILGSGYSMLVIWLVTAVLAVTAMILPAKRMFVK